ncbi:unnamed protein product, partial [Choristocarpus tenellus]
LDDLIESWHYRTVRAVWQRDKEGYCWIISDSGPFVTSTSTSRRDSQDKGVVHNVSTSAEGSAEQCKKSCKDRRAGRTSTCSMVQSFGTSGWGRPKAMVAELASALGSVLTIPLVELAADLIQDAGGTWWLTQVKAFRFQVTPNGKPFPKSEVSANKALPQPYVVDDPCFPKYSCKRKLIPF